MREWRSRYCLFGWFSISFKTNGKNFGKFPTLTFPAMKRKQLWWTVLHVRLVYLYSNTVNTINYVKVNFPWYAIDENDLPRAYEAAAFTSSLCDEKESNMTVWISLCPLKSLQQDNVKQQDQTLPHLISIQTITTSYT